MLYEDQRAITLFQYYQRSSHRKKTLQSYLPMLNQFKALYGEKVFENMGSDEVYGFLENFSPREREILQLVAEGKTSAAIADILFISPKTVETYRSRLMHKLGLKDTASLVKFAIVQGLTGVD